jgi:hypothetical protein
VWTLVALLVVFFLSILFALAGWWDHILRYMAMADVHLNAFGYLCLSITLFVVWLAVFVFFDRLVYVTFSRGQFRMHLAVGAGETAYEVNGMVVRKKRDDLFRYGLLGFGSGDLIVRTGGRPGVLRTHTLASRFYRWRWERCPGGADRRRAATRTG